jgi:PAS domain S-box-containing protein
MSLPRTMLGEASPVPPAGVSQRVSRHDVALEQRRLARTIASSALEGMFVMDGGGRIVEFNPAAEAAFGITREKAMSRSVSELIPPGLRLARRNGLARYLNPGRAQRLDRRFETFGVRADGTRFPLELMVTRVPDPGPPLFVGFLRDLSACKRVERELRESMDRLREADAERLRLLRRLVAAHEEERKHIASAIHDDPIQAVVALGMRVSALRRTVTDHDVRTSLEQIEEGVSDAVSRLRRLMFDLHPTTLEQEGLASTVETHLSQLDEEDAPSFVLKNELAEEPSLRVRLAMYRVIQEAIANARKHAHAHNVVVHLLREEDECVARILDDGGGFAIDQIESPAGHLGLSTMREQAEMAGGGITIESGAGMGTTVEARIPAEPAELSGEAPSSPQPERARHPA